MFRFGTPVDYVNSTDVYLSADIRLVSEHGRRHLGSSSYRTLAVPRTRTTLGVRSFAVAVPRMWNSCRLMGLLQLRCEHDSSTHSTTIRLRFGYNTLQHATRFFVRSHTRSYTRISGRRVLHVDWQLNTHSFYCILI